MGRRGPKPTPTTILKLRGSRKADRPFEPEPPKGEVIPPTWLHDDARAIWDEIAPPAIEMGVLSAYESGKFADYCTLLARYRREFPELSPRDVASMRSALRSLEASFGIGASERAGLKVERKVEAKPTKSRFFKASS